MPAQTNASLPEGLEVGGYRIVKKISSGGFAIVYLATDDKVLSEYEQHRLKANIKTGHGIHLVNAIFNLATFDTSLEELTKRIKETGELISTLPTSTGVPEGSIGFNLMFASGKNVQALQQHFSEHIEVLVSGKQTEQQTIPKLDHAVKSSSTTVRVDIDKLDRILNTIGELTLAKDAVRRIGAEMEELNPYLPLIRDIHKISVSLESRLGELQDELRPDATRHTRCRPVP